MLRLFHDFTSPASALAVLRMHELVDEGLAVEFVGLEIAQLARPVPPSAALREELHHHRASLHQAGLVAVCPHLQPPTLLAHVVGALAADHGCGRTWRELCYRLYFERGGDLSDRGVLTAMAGRIGLPEGAVVDVLDDEEAARRLRRRTAGHRVRGVRTVPTLEVDETLLPGLLEGDQLRRLAG